MDKHDQSFRIFRNAQYGGQAERQSNVAGRSRLLRGHATQAFAEMNKAHTPFSTFCALVEIKIDAGISDALQMRWIPDRSRKVHDQV
jgi:hypothetical protein